ncbi:hypothetical protein EYF80_057389 [Liparis tanakae]|uniref:Uncharacterized protein n=1 Tax=Liparis tanakae TaxID=230148 RepID=A0A4Z2EV81_9TELE|nr:hypothetical protein EYF80_057389 [Liparis tanakae]
MVTSSQGTPSLRSSFCRRTGGYPWERHAVVQLLAAVSPRVAGLAVAPGPEEHSSTSASHSAPSQPAAQLQLNWWNWSWHAPPLRQGWASHSGAPRQPLIGCWPPSLEKRLV